MIEMNHVKRIYHMGDEKLCALDDANFSVEKGEFVAIIGPSGSGKTTIMNILGLLDVPDSGDYFFDGVNVCEMSDNQLAEIRNRKIGFVFQDFNLLEKFSSLENIKVPLMYRGMSTKKSSATAYEYLKKVGLEGRETHLPSQLSGGQQQRVAIARALVCQPELILADEPTGALDSKTSDEIITLLQNLNQAGKTVILITHDQKVAERAKRVVKILDGRLYNETLQGDRK